MITTGMFFVFRMQGFLDRHFAQSTYFSWVGFLPLVLYALFILISDMIYKDLAVWLNDRGEFLALHSKFAQRTIARTTSTRTV